MADLSIRKAGAEDIPDIQRLFRQLDRYHVDLSPDVFQPVDGDARGDDVIQALIDRDDAGYLLADLDGKVAGFVSIQRSTSPRFPVYRPREYAMIEDAVVDEAVRGRGIGRALFAAALAWVKDLGLRHCQTSVWYENRSAREFYLDQGFRPISLRMELDTERKRE